MFSSRNTRTPNASLRPRLLLDQWRRLFQRLARLSQGRLQIAPIQGREIFYDLVEVVAIGQILEERLDLNARSPKNRSAAKDSLTPDDH